VRPDGKSRTKNEEFLVNKPDTTEEELKVRLRGCYDCDLKKSHSLEKDSSTSLQPRVRTRVVCKALDGQEVSPTKVADHKECERLIHVERKKFNPKHIAIRSGKK
jgi:hypothetical protein